MDGLTEAPALDADHFKSTFPVLVSIVIHDQKPPPVIPVLNEQFGSLGGLKLVGLTDNFGGVGVGVGFGFGVGFGVGVGVGGCGVGVGDGDGVGVEVGKAVTTRVIATCTFSFPMLIPNVAE